MKLAPIILFVYNRLEHTKHTIKALKDNVYALESELYIYSDGAKSDKQKNSVEKLRKYIREITGFKTIHIIERQVNYGLAKSIIDGVTTVINDYGKAIVLEDDLVTSPYFLKFMNDALFFYENNKKVWHISGWTYPVNFDINQDAFFWKTMNCWGWATWSDRWIFFEKNINKTASNFSKAEVKEFNLGGVENFWSQVIGNKKGKINTWAIFWYATIFKKSGLCLNPVNTYVKNIGNDGSGTNCGVEDIFKSKLSRLKNISLDKIEVKPSEKALKSIQNFYRKNKKNLIERVFNKLTRWLKS